MDDRYKKLLKQLDIIEPPKDLEKHIMSRIIAEETKLRRLKTFIFGISTTASFGLSFITVIYLIKSVQESGFWQYLSLLFSENGVILAYWRELSFSLAESLPVVGLIIFLASAGSFVWSFANMLRSTKVFNIRFSN